MKVVITGANRGIGAELAARYRARGDQVIGTARATGSEAILDVTDPASQTAFAARLGNDPLDLLVCNAGVYLEKDLSPDAYTADMWNQTLATNVTGVFLTVQALLPQLREGRGKIAIIASQMGASVRAKGSSIIYRVSKAAAINLGLNLATALKADGIAVGIYHPGWVKTDMGGSDADIDVAAAGAGLVARFDELDVATTGCFRNWDGTAHPL